MRIIAGKSRGRKLVDCSKVKTLRPTTDSNREALFNILNSSKVLRKINFQLAGSKVLDVFCGTGAIGLEALSRGAVLAGFIDRNLEHLSIAKKNCELLQEKKVEFFQADLLKTLFAAPMKYDFIYLDPPYGEHMALKALTNLIEAGWLNKQALIVIEHSGKEAMKINSDNILILEQRSYGKTLFTFLLFKASVSHRAN